MATSDLDNQHDNNHSFQINNDYLFRSDTFIDQQLNYIEQYPSTFYVDNNNNIYASKSMNLRLFDNSLNNSKDKISIPKKIHLLMLLIAEY